MSLPAQKAPGAPAIITQRMASDVSASRSACVIAAYIAAVSAFFFSGRFIRTVRTRACIGHDDWIAHILPFLFSLSFRPFAGFNRE